MAIGSLFNTLRSVSKQKPKVGGVRVRGSTGRYIEMSLTVTEFQQNRLSLDILESDCFETNFPDRLILPMSALFE